MPKVGRPTKYTEEFCGRAVELGREGYTVTEIATEFDVSKQTVYNWQEEHPEFLDAMVRARDFAEAWWSREGRKGIWSRDFNAPAYRLQMMNRFDWGEKGRQEITGADGGPIQVEDARGRLEKQLEGMGGRLAKLSAATNGETPGDPSKPTSNGAKGG